MDHFGTGKQGKVVCFGFYFYCFALKKKKKDN